MGSRRLMRGLLALPLGGAALFGVGCQTDEGPSRDALLAEAEEVRARLEQTQAALDASQSREASLEEENDRLLQEVASLSAQLQAAPEPGGADFGFEGVRGANVSTQGGDIVVEMAGDVLFASGSATLRNDAKRSLDQIAQVLNSRYAANEIRVAGHTDNDPIRRSQWKTNERLSAERALAVEDYLAERGVNRDRMHIAAYGPAKPRGSKQASRRVEIIVLGGS